MLVIGPGAIGAIVAARLAAAGHPVTVACRTRETAARIAEAGVCAVGVDGRELRARVVTAVSPDEVGNRRWRLVVLATKAADVLPALTTWRTAIGAATPVVALQNGLPDPVLANQLPEQLVECVVAFPATLTEVGSATQTGRGELLIGVGPEAMRGTRAGAGPDLHFVEDVLSRVAPTTIVPDIVGAKWTKLLINCCISTLGVVTARDLADLLGDARARHIFLRILAEGHAVGKARGVTFRPVGGLDPGLVLALGRLGAAGRGLQHSVLRLVGRKARRHRSSSLQSLERGRATEVDRLNGAVVRAGAEVGLATPMNQALVELVTGIEAGSVEPGLALLDALLADPATAGPSSVPLARA